MAMMIYTTGNGYQCSCCRQSSQEHTHFNEDEIDDLIQECINISWCADGDFYINEFAEFSGDHDELEKTIMAAISADEEARLHAKQIDDTRKSIARINQWFAELDLEKAGKIKRRDELRAKLAELEA